MAEFIDDLGVTRHSMGYDKLNELYKRIEDFIFDCTIDEVEENRDALTKVLTMVHQRMRDTRKQQ